MKANEKIDILLALYIEASDTSLPIKDRIEALKKLYRSKEFDILELEKAQVAMQTMSFLKVPDLLFQEVMLSNDRTSMIKIRFVGERGGVGAIELESNTFTKDYKSEQVYVRDAKDMINHDKLIFDSGQIRLVVYILRKKMNIEVSINIDENHKRNIVKRNIVTIHYEDEITKETKLIASSHARENKVLFKELPIRRHYNLKVLNDTIRLITLY